MRALVQRVRSAKVEVNGEVISEIGHGLLVLLGVAKTDTGPDADMLAGKTARLRIFEDEAGKMNRSVVEAGGSILVVSQFTLYGDTRRGNRPGFDQAALPDLADKLYQQYMSALAAYGQQVRSGVFGAEMLVTLENDGPVTLLLESRAPAATTKALTDGQSSSAPQADRPNGGQR